MIMSIPFDQVEAGTRERAFDGVANQKRQEPFVDKRVGDRLQYQAVKVTASRLG
jgi:hypothetical protein